ncbi:beta strand repeat-containing protein, partial [Singulisphaera rosea]
MFSRKRGGGRGKADQARAASLRGEDRLRRSRLHRARLLDLVLENLEERLTPSIGFTIGAANDSIVFNGSEDLYLEASAGVLAYHGVGTSEFTSTGFALDGASKVTYSGGKTYLAGMDRGGGNFQLQDAEISDDLATQGKDLSISARTIVVDDAKLVTGSSGTLQASGGSAYAITGQDATSNTVTLAAQGGSSTLSDGALLTYAGSSAGLENGKVYTIHVVDQSNAGQIQAQLYDPVTISTSPASTAADAPAGAIAFESAHETGDSSMVDFGATTPTITIGAYDRIVAKGTGTGADGAISATASYLYDSGYFSKLNPLDFLNSYNQSPSVTVGTGTHVSGGAVSFKATVGDQNVSTSTIPYVSDFLDPAIQKYLGEPLSLPISVVVKRAAAKVEVKDSATIESSDQVTLSSKATPNASGEAIYYFGGAAGVSFVVVYASSDAEALVDSKVVINAARTVTVEATTKTTASGTARVTQNTGTFQTNPKYLQISGAVNILNSTTHAIVADGATITSTHGNVNVSAMATDSTKTSIQTASYTDGYAGLTSSVTVVDADVKAYVGGTVTAGGLATGSTETLNPFRQVDFANSRFFFNTEPGYATGDPIVYSSGLGGAIPGLTTDTVYYAVVSNNGTGAAASQYYVRLAASPEDAAAGRFITFGQLPTLGGVPVTNVDTSSNSEILWDFDPGFTEGQSVAFTLAAGAFLGYDGSDGKLQGRLGTDAQGNPVTYKVHIVSSQVDSTHQYTIQLFQDGKLVQLDNSPYFTTASGTVVRIEAFDSTSDQIRLNPTDLSAGFKINNADALIYHAGLSTVVDGLTEGATYYAIVDPSVFNSIDPDAPPSLLLAASKNDAEAANPVTKEPTLTWTDGNGKTQTSTIQNVNTPQGSLLVGVGHWFRILSSDSTTRVLTIALESNSTVSTLTSGELLTYQGEDGDSSTLQDGRQYRVEVVDQSDPGAIQLRLQDVVRLPTLGTLSGTSQSFTIQDIPTDGDVVTMSLDTDSTVSQLTEGQTLVYHGASVTGSLEDGKTYLVHMINQASTDVIQVQLTESYPVTASGTLEGTGHSFSITASDPTTGIITVAEQAGATVVKLSEGETLTYNGPSIASTGYLQDGQQYKAHVVNQTKTSAIQLELISTSDDVVDSGFLVGTGHTFTIVGSDHATGIVTIAEQQGGTVASLTEGETLTFQGTSATASGTPEDGQTYRVHVVDQSNTSQIRVELRAGGVEVGYGTLSQSSGSYVIHGSDPTSGTLILARVGTAPALTDGDTLTFAGTSGTGASFLQDGRSYSVSVVVYQDDPDNIRVKLADYLSPAYGNLATGDQASSYTIKGVDSTAQSLVVVPRA